MNEDKMQHYKKIFDNYEGEHFIFGANLNEFTINYIEDIQTKIEEKEGPKEKGFDVGIQKRVINFGEKPFNLYSDDYDISKKETQCIEIYSLVLQKIENYYGILSHLSKYEKEKLNKKMTFYNFNLSLNQLDNKQNYINDEEDINSDSNSKNILLNLKSEDLEDTEFIDDIAEDLYLCAYYHCDRGNGELLEDITQSQNNAIIKCIYNYNDKKDSKKDKKENKEKKEENIEEDEMKNIWSEVLDENRPLEYEDKWGRRSPPAHSIIFTKKLKTKILISNSNLLQSIEERFTIEFWIKLKDINNINIFTKDSFSLNIDNGKFKLDFRGQEIPNETIKEYELPMDQFIHLAILYKKTSQIIMVLLNCEEILKFNIMLSGIENNTPLIFGNEKLEGEMTEIRIWNQKMPINYIKENYKVPLPILAENKGKLKMNIELKSKNITKRNDSVFIFGDKNKGIISSDSNDKLGANSSKNIINFNKCGTQIFDNNLLNMFNDEEYPTIDVVNSNNKIDEDNFTVKSCNNLFFQEKDFIFDN